MSLPVSYLVDDAARQIADPDKTRVKPAEWLGHYNMSIRELCEKANVLKYRGLFTLEAGPVYAYPEDMTVMTGLEVTETPDDEGTFRFLGEKFEDEFRAMTSRSYPEATIPKHYFADTSWFYLIGKPSAQIIGGGRITYFGLPDRIFDLPSATFQLPSFTQDYVTRRMVVYGLQSRHRLDEAAAMLKLWYADVEGLGDAMTDRSQDRRSALRTGSNPMRGMR